MSATALIMFREVLEAALVVSIVLAATRGVAKRGQWALLGIGAGVLGAGIVAAFAEVITEAVGGIGQELFQASVLFIAVAMLGWHNAWMARAGRSMSRELGALGQSIRDAARPSHVIAVVVGLAILREGSEAVLFLYGIAVSGQEGAAPMIVGGAIGVLLGIAVGIAAYFGLVRLAGKYLFLVTGALILFLAAGMAAQGAKLLNQAGVLPTLGQQVWDTSALISDRGGVGNFLHVLIGYTSQPDGIQVLFYVLTLMLIGGFMYALRNRKRAPAVAAALFVAAMTVAAPGTRSAHAADLKVYSPIVEQGEFGIEYRGNVISDGDKSISGSHVHHMEIEYTPTDFWHAAIVGEVEKEPGSNAKYTTTGLESIFQLFPQGKYWLDLGLYAEYEFGHGQGAHDAFEWKILAEKNFGPVTVTLNPIFENEVGKNAHKSMEFQYAARAKWRLMPEFEPAIEAFGEMGEIRKFDPRSDQRHQIGPAVLGRFKLGNMSAIKYEAGYMFGLTGPGSPARAFKWLLEFEYHF